MSDVSQTLQLPSLESAIALSGSKEVNLAFFSRHTGTQVVLRGQSLDIRGQEKAVKRWVVVH
ncbi:hypothetical protein [[Leptolyngbya] sp. PCC 7376]|uniref:hypothetical protein n=1 Tax=[Leptolyngbya] sp. PCC 7376 TaxID=111781 RepID=UPI000314C218|nr:hypothetical protein [[Leptolyngbya] sp. PCC 7376]